jgi:hypothetical protein
MTDDDRARLERAKEHPAYREAMGRDPADYTVPVLVLGLFYLLLPMAFLAPLVFLASGHIDALVLVGLSAAYFAWAVPFLIAAVRLYPLRRLPVARWLGVVSPDAPSGRSGRWIRLERLDGGAIDLRLRMRAYLESTGGAAAPGKVGVAMCKGDQIVEWIVIPDVSAEAEPAV